MKPNAKFILLLLMAVFSVICYASADCLYKEWGCSMDNECKLIADQTCDCKKLFKN